MSETKSTAGQPLDAQGVSQISGGGLDMCSPDQIRQLVSDMKDNYDRLVDFTSYVIDRINGGPYTGP